MSHLETNASVFEQNRKIDHSHLVVVNLPRLHTDKQRLLWGVLFAFASLDGSFVTHAAAVEMAHPQPGVSPPTERTRTTEVLISAYEGRALHMHNFCFVRVLPQSIYYMNMSKLL